MLRLDETHLNCVIYLCIDELDDYGVSVRTPNCTGFFLQVLDAQDPNYSLKYVVTARHCIDSAPKDIYLRVNLKDGSTKDYLTQKTDWMSHDSADVAAIHFIPTDEEFRKISLSCIRSDQMVDRDYRFHGLKMDPNQMIETTFAGGLDAGIPVEIGNEIVSVGLFSQHAGTGKNLPIARFGRISRMPSEPVTMIGPGSTKFEVLGYLAEFQSQPGFSGSPVLWTVQMALIDFVPIPGNVTSHAGEELAPRVPLTRSINLIHVLGLISGHFGVESDTQTSGDILGRVYVKENSGITAITPASAIMELLMRDDIRKEREQRLEESKSKGRLAAEAGGS